MEGTSGAAARVSLRGDMRKAALKAGFRASVAQPGEPVQGSRKSVHFNGGDFSLR